MRLLYLSADPGIPMLGHKGASVHVRELVTALQRAGAEVLVASPRVCDEGDRFPLPVPLIPVDPVLPKTHTTPRSARSAIEAQRRQIERLCRKLRVDALYERYSLFSDAGVHASRRLGVPHILEVNAPLRAEARRHRTLPHARLAAEIESAVFALTARCLCVSDGVARAVRRHRAAAPTQVVPNGVDPARFCGRKADRNARDVVVGFAGSLKPWHGIETLVEACEIAFPLEPRLQLEVVGDGPLRSSVQSAALPRDRLRVAGPIDHAQAIEAMHRWDVGAAPYRGEPGFYFSSLKVLEYMAAGVCPVASDLGELRSLLRDGRGVLVPPDDPPALAEALLLLARSPDLVSAAGNRARNWVLVHRTWARNAEIVLDRFRQVGRRAAA